MVDKTMSSELHTSYISWGFFYISWGFCLHKWGGYISWGFFLHKLGYFFNMMSTASYKYIENSFSDEHEFHKTNGYIAGVSDFANSTNIG